MSFIWFPAGYLGSAFILASRQEPGSAIGLLGSSSSCSANEQSEILGKLLHFFKPYFPVPLERGVIKTLLPDFIGHPLGGSKKIMLVKHKEDVVGNQ